MSSTTETPTPTTTHLSSLAAALEPADRLTLARTFAELADEALVVCEEAPTQQLRDFWLRLSETFHHESQKRIAQPKPKRRWFR